MLLSSLAIPAVVSISAEVVVTAEVAVSAEVAVICAMKVVSFIFCSIMGIPAREVILTVATVFGMIGKDG